MTQLKQYELEQGDIDKGWGGAHLAQTPCGDWTPHAEAQAALEAQQERIRKLVEALKAADRIWRNEYVIWHVAGGPNECPHGYAAGIHCRLCDRTTVVVALAAEGVE